MKSNKNSQTAPLGLTMGDPSGVGPEIALKALSIQSIAAKTVIIGDFEVLKNTAQMLNLNVQINTISDLSQFDPAKINVLSLNLIHPSEFELGKVQEKCGYASYAYIEKSIELAMDKKIAGVVTNPINKEALKSAGINYPGHTEIFADKTNTRNYSMLFLLKNVGVAHVTTHCSVRKAIDLIAKDTVYTTIKLLNTAMTQLGIQNPRIAVGGLNPHAGENGLFGCEEIDHIIPAIKAAQEEEINVTGPYPPDTVFMKAFRGEFDGIVAMLHDHGFVALKSLDFEHGVNITIGLPIIRTSVGHGTAFDIAGKGIASDKSLVSSIDTAWLLFKNRML
jgi:4-hydroxythreonine-4-phosphate dehydrogenase